MLYVINHKKILNLVKVALIWPIFFCVEHDYFFGLSYFFDDYFFYLSHLHQDMPTFLNKLLLICFSDFRPKKNP